MKFGCSRFRDISEFMRKKIFKEKGKGEKKLKFGCSRFRDISEFRESELRAWDSGECMEKEFRDKREKEKWD